MDTNAIQKRIAAIEKLREEIKVSQEAIKNALDNDAVYKQAEQQAKDANAKKRNYVRTYLIKRRIENS